MAGEREALRDWHRLFGLLLMDFFTGSPFVVELERDLSVQQQLFDVVIVRRRPGRFADRLPDGLEGLRAHNLLTFKSHHEALDAWAMKELLGHYVAYRKLVSRALPALLAEDQLGLYAVTARFPHNLSGQVPWQRVQPGVYDCRWGTDTVRVVVAGELPQEAHNAPLHLFSAAPALLQFGRTTYRQHSNQTSGLLGELLETFAGEGLAMPYTMHDFVRDYIKKHLPQLSPEERDQVLQTLPPEQRLAGLPAEQRLAGLPPEQRLAGLPAEQRLAGLPAEEIRQYLDRLSAERPAAPRKRRRKKE